MKAPGGSEHLDLGTLRPTAQRLIVAESLRRAGRTITAQELYARLRDEHPYLGRATVFRTLDLLVRAGLAQRFQEGGVATYTGCRLAHHHHLVCRSCGRTSDIGEDEIDPLISRIRRRYRFALDHQALDFYGTCDRCRRNGKLTRPVGVAER